MPTLKDDLAITDGSAAKFLARTITPISQNNRRHCNRTFRVQGYLGAVLALSRSPSGAASDRLRIAPTLAVADCRKYVIGGDRTAVAVDAGICGEGDLAQQNCFVGTTFVKATGETRSSTEQNLILMVSAAILGGLR